MSKIEEALKKIEGQGLAKPPEPAVSPATKPVWRTPPEVKADLEVLEDHRVVTVTDPRSPASEEYRKLKARVLQATHAKRLNSILVTSASYGEGKTTTALNLAISIAEELHHTALLVDADLRKPSLHQSLGLTPRKGLSDYLKDDGVRLEDILIKTPIPKLTLLPGREDMDNSSEWLSSEKMARLVKEIKERYPDRYVVYDAMPLLPAADTSVLSTLMDGVILVIQWARTSQDDAQKAVSLIGREKLLGVVMNNVSTTFKTYHSYYGGYGTYGAESSNGGWMARVKKVLWKS